MDERFDRCVREGKLVKASVQQDLISKEMNAAISDLETAKQSILTKNFKWATVQAYYSMFHVVKALVLSKGYREKSHLCLSIAFKTLFIDTGILESKHFNRFRDCMSLREDADYGLIYSDGSASTSVEWASELLEAAQKALKLP